MAITAQVRDLHISKEMAEIIRDCLEIEYQTDPSNQEIKETLEQLDNIISSFPD